MESEDQSQYDEALATLRAAMDEVNADPDGEAPLAALRGALDALPDHAPLLAEDPGALELRLRAELVLARAQLYQGDRYAAAATLDTCLERAGGIPLDSARLGPRLGALVDERREVQAARGEARLRVECAEPCRVLIDERNYGSVERSGQARELSLPLGEHRVWLAPLEPLEGKAEPLRVVVQLDSTDDAPTLSFPVPSPGDGPATDGAPVPAPTVGAERRGALGLRSPPMGETDRDRLAPRWLEITGIAIGGAELIAGATLWALDSRCPGGGDVTDVEACPQLYDTKTAGIVLSTLGLAAVATSGALLGVDSSRARRAAVAPTVGPRSVGLSVGGRF